MTLSLALPLALALPLTLTLPLGVTTEDIRFPDNSGQIECIDGRLGIAIRARHRRTYPYSTAG